MLHDVYVANLTSPAAGQAAIGAEEVGAGKGQGSALMEEAWR